MFWNKFTVNHGVLATIVHKHDLQRAPARQDKHVSKEKNTSHTTIPSRHLCVFICFFASTWHMPGEVSGAGTSQQDHLGPRSVFGTDQTTRGPSAAVWWVCTAWGAGRTIGGLDRVGPGLDIHEWQQRTGVFGWQSDMKWNGIGYRSSWGEEQGTRNGNT